MSESRYKITDTIYNVMTYDRNGKINVSTNIRYLDYIVWDVKKEAQQKIKKLVYLKSTWVEPQGLEDLSLLDLSNEYLNFIKREKLFPGP